MRRFQPADLSNRLRQPGPAPLLLDVREPWEYDICHIEGSRLVPMGQLPAVVDDLEKDVEIVVICHHGIRSRYACQYLASLGFADLINLEGGVEAWATQIDPAMPRY
ncbi:MAG TPA: sulfurtransferase [Gammaproteobacteria bacterium]|nr:sulfurtransferase [Gammaproteobacteria bacterium]